MLTKIRHRLEALSFLANRISLPDLVGCGVHFLRTRDPISLKQRLFSAAGLRSQRIPSSAFLKHRNKGLRLLAGSGIEIGALHEPSPVPKACQVAYVDAVSKEEASLIFPEIDPSLIMDAAHIADLDTQGLAPIQTGSQDFVILNHVIEHVANPMRVIQEIFRVLKPRGLAVISVPDKNFTFDKPRELTSFEHLLEEFRADVKSVDDGHYLDFLKGVHPELLSGTPETVQRNIDLVRKRREHAHVWDSRSFKCFMERTLHEVLGIEATPVFESLAETNQFEYFSVWRAG